MPSPSSVLLLPEAVREALDRRIVAAGFGGYDDHTAWLAERGHTISASAVKRYGKKLKRAANADAARASEAAAAVVARVRQAAEMARAINEAAGENPLALPEKTAELLMGRLYALASSEEIDAKTLQIISRSLNDSLRAMAFTRLERDEVRKAARAEAAEAAVGAADREAKNAGAPFSPEVLRRIREEVYGIFTEPPA